VVASKALGRRRGIQSWLVEPYRQVKLGLIFLVFNLVFAALIFSVFGYYVMDMYGAVTAHLSLSQQEDQLLRAKYIFPVMVGAGLILFFIVTTLAISIKYTHQIYGPLVSIHRFLDGLLEGKHVELLHLRESDQLKDLATKLNTVSELLSGDKRQSTLLPVYRFLDDLIAGENPQPLKFRESDQLQMLSEKLNSLALKLNKKV
jgi:hypothetical protein